MMPFAELIRIELLLFMDIFTDPPIDKTIVIVVSVIAVFTLIIVAIIFVLRERWSESYEPLKKIFGRFCNLANSVNSNPGLVDCNFVVLVYEKQLKVLLSGFF